MKDSSSRVLSDTQNKIKKGDSSLSTENITWVISKTGYSSQAIKNFIMPLIM